MRISIREATEQERADGFPNPHAKTAADPPRQDCPRYLLWDPAAPDKHFYVFGLIQGGETREAAVFWAERMSSKNGIPFERPEGWEDVKGELEESAA